MHERYSIEVDDESVMIYGDLSIEEAFDFLNFFDKKGFKSLTLGYENSTIYMRRKSIEQVEEDVRIRDHKLSEKFYENCHEAEKKEHEKTRNRVKELESLVKTIISDKSERIRNLEKVNAQLLKSLQLDKLKNDAGIQELLSGFGMSRPMTEEEKDGPFNELLKLKKDPPDIMPTVEELINDHRSEDGKND